MDMIEIKADIVKGYKKVGEMELELTEREFNSFIKGALKLEAVTSVHSTIKFRDVNGNSNENFTIPD